MIHAPASRSSRPAEDRALFARYLDLGDPVDRDMLIERFLPLARQLARRYQRPDVPFDDVFQVACLGLIHAIDRFDLERGVAFSSYAVPTILGEIKRYFRDRTWSVRVPRDLQDLALKVDRAVGDLTGRLNREPTVPELAARVGATEEDVVEALAAYGALRSSSLDEPTHGDDETDTLGDSLNPWVFAMFRTLMTVEPKSASEQAAYAKWLDQRSDREDARADRVHGAEGVIPAPLWIVLVLSAVMIFVFMLFFADSAERAIVQATMMGGVAIVISATLLVVVFLNNPYHAGIGRLRPVAMERATVILDQESAALGLQVASPCNERGTRTAAG